MQFEISWLIPTLAASTEGFLAQPSIATVTATCWRSYMLYLFNHTKITRLSKGGCMAAIAATSFVTVRSTISEDHTGRENVRMTTTKRLTMMAVWKNKTGISGDQRRCTTGFIMFYRLVSWPDIAKISSVKSSENRRKRLRVSMVNIEDGQFIFPDLRRRTMA